MSLFNVAEAGAPSAEQLADGFLKETNQKFEIEKRAAYDAVQRFWYRNTDGEGNPSVSGVDAPTGEEILRAMGTNAAHFMGAATKRVEMLLGIQAALGVDEIDLAKIAAPFDMTFKPDGSLDTVTPRA